VGFFFPLILLLQIHITWKHGSGGKDCCALLFQDSILINELTVAENILLAMHQSALQPVSRAAVDEILERVGLDSRVGDLMPDELSGGMRKRAALAQVCACACVCVCVLKLPLLIFLCLVLLCIFLV
jgi:ABC-type transporter Mla maintaining outer membrane lipid asymmetry ATPase subunit MlaF